jgi:OmpA-OmpF porin, OOP family
MRREVQYVISSGWRAGLALVAASGCSMVTVQQAPFTPLEVSALAPPPPPAAPPSRVTLTDSSILINDKVQFEFGKADIRSESFSLLDDVAKVLVDDPQIELVEVEGFTDSVGTAAGNRKLSGDRAAAVKIYLMKKGISADRLASKGFGPDRPVADNSTDEGREKNRRVEFKIMKQIPKKAVVQNE